MTIKDPSTQEVVIGDSPPGAPRNQRLAELISSWLQDESGHDETFWPVIERDLAETLEESWPEARE